MVNPDSDLARAHPDWVLRAGALAGALAPPARARPRRPEACAYLLEPARAVLAPSTTSTTSSGTTTATCSTAVNRRRPTAGVHAPDPGALPAARRAARRVTPAWRSSPAPPAGPASTSASSPAPTGSGPATPTTRSSGSDPALDRAAAAAGADRQRTSGRPGAHHRPHASTCRSAVLTALFGHCGIEWDITELPDDERAPLPAWSAMYRRARGLLHPATPCDPTTPTRPRGQRGRVARPGGCRVHRRLGRHRAWGHPGTVPLPGLDPDRRVPVRVRADGRLPADCESSPPAWWDEAVGDGVVVSGAALGLVGLAMPVLAPAQGSSCT